MTGIDAARDRQEAAAAGIGRAVRAWLNTLEPARLERATFPFESAERFVWDYVPGTREGLSLGDMSPIQRDAAMGIVGASLSERGSGEVRSIIALEPILGELERGTRRAGWERRDPDLYWFAVFGEPAEATPWAWRVGGHHVAIQLTLADGRVIGSAPSFLGANPATVPSGPHAGQRALAGEEDLARALLTSLTPDQRRIAVVDPVAPPDILSGSGPRVGTPGLPGGIRHDELDGAQGEGLERLVRHYLDRARPEVGDAEWERIVAAGLGGVAFAWAGPDARGKGHYYAIHGPGFLIEYDNTQNGANHIHAVWRDLTNDWGSDVLANHYRVGHRTAGGPSG